MSTVYEDLVRGRALITEPHHWTRNALCRHAPDGGKAYCDLGAAVVATGGVFHENGFIYEGCDAHSYALVTDALWAALAQHDKRFLSSGSKTNAIAFFNNTHSHAESLALWDRAIEANKPAEVEQETVEWELPVEELVPA